MSARKISTIGVSHSIILTDEAPQWYKDRSNTVTSEMDVEQPLLATSRRQTRLSLLTSLTPDDHKFGFDASKLQKKKIDLTRELNSRIIFQHCLIGIVNATVLVPTMVGYCSIIFRDEFFQSDELQQEYFPKLLKLVFLSSAVHQAMFLICSSLPFAVGQVQDAGLIFLSSMASKIVSNMNNKYPDAHTGDIVITVIVSLSLCTAILGILLYLVGKFKLAELVQYLPLPVVGGYLAFIGLFCGLNGLSLMTNDSRFNSVGGLYHIFEGNLLLLSLPGLLAALVLFMLSQHTNKSLLPLSLFSFPIIFYLLMFFTSSTLEDVRKDGWVGKTSVIPSIFEVFNLFDINHNEIYFDAAFPDILPDFIAMFFIVAFGSCLDVAAVQFELGRPLDYNHEMKSVGLSNFVSGIFGGYTGSYIFSQSIFTLKNKVDTRLSSLCVLIIELLIVVSYIDLMGYLPRFFFGCVLIFVAYDLMIDWLYVAYFRLQPEEYFISCFTFVAICATSLQVGMVLGFILSTLVFTFNYSKLSAVKQLNADKSHVIHSIREQDTIDKQRNRIVILKLFGSQFFGTSQKIMTAVRNSIKIEDEANSDNENEPNEGNSVLSDESEVFETKFLILDCSEVSSMDATFARGCILTLLFVLSELDVELIFTNLSISCKELLLKHDIIRQGSSSVPAALSFDTLMQGIEHCEDKLIAGLVDVDTSRSPKEIALMKIFESCRYSSIEAYFNMIELEKDELYIPGKAAELAVVIKGRVRIESADVFSTKILGLSDFVKETMESKIVSLSEKSQILVLSKESFSRLKAKDPVAAMEVQEQLLKELV